MSNMGWICPRCQKAKAPSVLECNCPATFPVTLPMNPVYVPIPTTPFPPAWTPPMPVTCTTRAIANGNAVN